MLHDRGSISPIAQVATKEHVDLVADRAFECLEKMIHMEGKSTIKWVAAMMVVQTVAILTGTAGLVKLFM